MTLCRRLGRATGLLFCTLVFAGTAVANNGNGNGNKDESPGNSGSAPGQVKKAEPAPAPAVAPAAAPVAAQTPAATPTSARAPHAAQAEKQEAKAAPAAKAEKPEKGAKAAAKSGKTEEKSEGKSEHTSGSYKNTSHGVNEDKPEQTHRHTICHATGSASNPYVRITPSVSGVFHGHMGHQDERDIIPPFTYKNQQYSLNWDARGQAIFNAGCAVASPRQQQTDVCPNIEGMQTTVPQGLVRDASGNCVRPPAQTDVCPNIEGMQTTVPAGLVKDSQGNCVVPVAGAAVDVCPNVEGMQTAVPTGFVRNAQGNCVAPTVVTAARAPSSEVLGAATPAPAAKAKATAKAKAKPKPAGGVLGAVASAPEATVSTASSGNLPFTGIPLWIAALIGGALLATGLTLRRAF
jgi:hypothetical protein